MRIPQTFSAHGVFAFDILPNIVIVAFATYLSLAVINIASGHISRRIFTSVPIGAGRVADVRGRLLTNVDTGRPVHTTTIREYAEWNGESVTAIAETPVKTSPSGSGSGNGSGNGEESEFTYDRGNGDTDDQRPQEVRPDGRDMPPTPDTDYDRWNAVAFVTERDTDAAPDDVRVALNHIAANETVWVAPSLPFAFAILLGTVIALIAGTSLFLAPLG